MTMREQVLSLIRTRYRLSESEITLTKTGGGYWRWSGTLGEWLSNSQTPFKTLPSSKYTFEMWADDFSGKVTDTLPFTDFDYLHDAVQYSRKHYG